MHKPINPFITNIMIDSCAFDPKYGAEQEAANKIFDLSNNAQILLIVAHSVKKEIDHPNTPQEVKSMAGARLYSIKTSLTYDEGVKKEKILSILTGNGNSEKYVQDANHVFEASKYGSYFITTDKRILDKRLEIASVTGNAFWIITPSEMMKIINFYQQEVSGESDQ